MYLEQACKERGVEFVIFDPTKINRARLGEINSTDLVYRALTNADACELEWQLVRAGATSLHTDALRAHQEYRTQKRVFDMYDVPTPKTITHATNNKALLKEYVETLGGFPIALKVSGGQYGVGVMKIDSLVSLFTVTDYVVTQKAQFVLMEFIHVSSSARIIVVGDTVVGTMLYNAPKDDFRSTATGNQPRKMDFDKSVTDAALKATRAIGTEYAGVDVLIGEDGQPYVTEANFPCYFATTQRVTGVDIAGAIVDYLVQKAEK
jgi:RimK family alpha-L-glutamate ligase